MGDLNAHDADAVLRDQALELEFLELEMEDSSEPEHIRDARVKQFKDEMEMLKTLKEMGTSP